MATTNLPDGVTNAALNSTLTSLVMPDPTVAYVFFDDFINYTATDWVITSVGAGNANIITNAAGGVLQNTLDANDNDHVYYQWSSNTGATVVEQFRFVAGKKAWCKCRAKINEVIQSDFLMGLYVTDTDPITSIANGVFFRKDDGSAALTFQQISSAASSTTTAVGTMVADTYCTFGYYYNGQGTVDVFFNENRVATVATTNTPFAEELAVSFVIQAGEATNVKILSTDYMFFAQER